VGMLLKNKLILTAIGLAVIGMLYVFSREPSLPSPRTPVTPAPKRG
jgi:hypothetical protein